MMKTARTVLRRRIGRTHGTGQNRGSEKHA